MIDCHTHHLHHDAIVSRTPADSLTPGYAYSVAIHPWDSHTASERDFEVLREMAARPDVLAIGETGLDRHAQAYLKEQTDIMTRHVELSESLGKPLIIHSVGTWQDIVALKRRLQPTQQWIVHGFRRNPLTAKPLIDAGIGISLGEHFNPLTAAAIPSGLLFIETDESLLPITEIARRVALARGTDTDAIIDIARHNLSSICHI